MVLIVSLMSTAVAQHPANNTYPTYEFSLDSVMPSLVGNATNSSFFGTIPPQLYYNTTTDRKPIQEIVSQFNLTGLTPEQMAVVMAFPALPTTTTATITTTFTTTESYDEWLETNSNVSSNVNQTDGESRDVNFTARALNVPVVPAFEVPLKRLQAVRPVVRPQVVNNYYIQRRNAQSVTLPVAKHMVNEIHGNVAGVRMSAFSDAKPQLLNVDFDGVRPHYPSFPMPDVKASPNNLTAKPDYPSTDMEPPVLDAIFN